MRSTVGHVFSWIDPDGVSLATLTIVLKDFFAADNLHVPTRHFPQTSPLLRTPFSPQWTHAGRPLVGSMMGEPKVVTGLWSSSSESLDPRNGLSQRLERSHIRLTRSRARTRATRKQTPQMTRSSPLENITEINHGIVISACM